MTELREARSMLPPPRGGDGSGVYILVAGALLLGGLLVAAYLAGGNSATEVAESPASVATAPAEDPHWQERMRQGEDRIREALAPWILRTLLSIVTMFVTVPVAFGVVLPLLSRSDRFGRSFDVTLADGCEGSCLVMLVAIAAPWIYFFCFFG